MIEDVSARRDRDTIDHRCLARSTRRVVEHDRSIIMIQVSKTWYSQNGFQNIAVLLGMVQETNYI